MKKHLIILIVLILSEISCSNSSLQERRMTKIAVKITERLDSNSVKTFENWDYYHRGELGFWSRIEGDSVLYNCSLSNKIDSSEIIILNPTVFKRDYSVNYDFDTVKYRKYRIVRHGLNLQIIAEDSSYKEYFLESNISQDSLFPSSNPFTVIQNLTALKDSLKIEGIGHFPGAGNFTQFYLTDPYVLTYLPDDLKLSEFSRKIWEQEFKRGKMIKKNWNLRKRT